MAEAATQEAYDKGRRDERERIVRLLQELYARHYQMARQERVSWVRMALYDQARGIEEAIRHIEEDRRCRGPDELEQCSEATLRSWKNASDAELEADPRVQAFMRAWNEGDQ